MIGLNLCRCALNVCATAVLLAGCSQTNSTLPQSNASTPSLHLEQRAPKLAQSPPKSKFARYSIIDLGTLGGKVSGANGINNRGWTTGVSDLRGDHAEHAVLWRGTQIVDLGAQLGGPSSAVAWDWNDNDHGEIVGVAQTSQLDPNQEQWIFTCLNGNPCEGGDLISLGFLWQHGVMTALPTLGGTNGNATGINNRGQAVGYAETNFQDPTCISPQVLDWEAVLWRPKKNAVQELPPFTGDVVGAAAGINDGGEAVGGSGPSCGPGPLSGFAHAVLWRNGSAIDLGSLGGTMNNLAADINNRGQIVGFSDLSGDATFHAFLWRGGKMRDVGVLPGDAASNALAINDKGQVLGNSCDSSGNCRVFLWQDGVMANLRNIIRSNAWLQPVSAGSINNRGEISGWAFNQRNGETVAFLAIPQQGSFAAVQAPDVVPQITLPEHVRHMLLQRMRLGHF